MKNIFILIKDANLTVIDKNMFIQKHDKINSREKYKPWDIEEHIYKIILTTYKKPSDSLSEILSLLDKMTDKYRDMYKFMKTNTKYDKLYEEIKNEPYMADYIMGQISLIERNNTELEKKITIYNEQTEIYKTLLRETKEDMEKEEMEMTIYIDTDKFMQKLSLLHDLLDQINIKVTKVLKMTGYDREIIEEKITEKENISKKWYSTVENNGNNGNKGNVNTEIKGGSVANILENIGEINKFDKLNKKIKKLLDRTEKYKMNCTVILNKYVSTVQHIQEIIIYIYYRLTVYNDTIEEYTHTNKKDTIYKRFNKNELIEMKQHINNISRKNFGYLKKYSVAVIDDLIERLDKSGNINIVSEIMNSNGDDGGNMNLLLLHHLLEHVNMFKKN